MADMVQHTSGPEGRRRAKVACPLGPAADSQKRITQLAEAGMDIARLNFSHGDRADHEQRCRAVRQAASDTGRAVGILADLQGPKIRLGRFGAGPAGLAPRRVRSSYRAGQLYSQALIRRDSQALIRRGGHRPARFAHTAAVGSAIHESRDPDAH